MIYEVEFVNTMNHRVAPGRLIYRMAHKGSEATSDIVVSEATLLLVADVTSPAEWLYLGKREVQNAADSVG